jgi:hypothetical protein
MTALPDIGNRPGDTGYPAFLPRANTGHERGIIGGGTGLVRP